MVALGTTVINFCAPAECFPKERQPYTVYAYCAIIERSKGFVERTNFSFIQLVLLSDSAKSHNMQAGPIIVPKSQYAGRPNHSSTLRHSASPVADPVPPPSTD
jgi:hypothetical protein